MTIIGIDLGVELARLIETLSERGEVRAEIDELIGRYGAGTAAEPLIRLE